MNFLAAMSGGVDSAVAAARAVEAGHDVVGVHLALSRMPGTLRTGSRGCCTIEDSRDAWRACDILGIPYYVWDFSERFKEDVVDDFVAEYAAGRTPNPCMRCNERIKFAALLEKALRLLRTGCEMIYSTCSVLAQENENIVARVLRKANAEVVPLKLDAFSWVPQLPVSIPCTLCVCPEALHEGCVVAKSRRRK